MCSTTVDQVFLLWGLSARLRHSVTQRRTNFCTIRSAAAFFTPPVTTARATACLAWEGNVVVHAYDTLHCLVYACCTQAYSALTCVHVHVRRLDNMLLGVYAAPGLRHHSVYRHTHLSSRPTDTAQPRLQSGTKRLTGYGTGGFSVFIRVQGLSLSSADSRNR